jgi:hypothetical protein
LTVNLSAGTTRFEILSALLVPGSDYQVGIQTVGENGYRCYRRDIFDGRVTVPIAELVLKERANHFAGRWAANILVLLASYSFTLRTPIWQRR